jgi:hypothetical protein
MNANLLADRGTRDVLVEGCLLSRSAGAALDLAGGGTVRGNMFYGNPVGLSAGAPLRGSVPELDEPAAVQVTGNVFLHGQDATDGQGGRGVVLSHVRSAKVVNNIFARSLVKSEDEAMALHLVGPRGGRGTGVHDVAFESNTTYDWSGYRLEPTSSRARDLTQISVRDNLVQCPGRKLVLARLDEGYVPQYGFARNFYHSAREENAWFRAMDKFFPFTVWVRGAHEAAAAARQVEFEEPERDLGRFNGAAGKPASARAYIESHLDREAGHWDENVAPTAAVEWIREGFAPGDNLMNKLAGAVPGREN